MAVAGTLRARLRAGDASLSVSELVAGVLAPHAPEAQLVVSHQLVAVGLAQWASADAEERARGLGLTRLAARRLRNLAALVVRSESERCAMPSPIRGPEDVLAHVGDIRGARQERVVALYLDARNRPLGREIVAVGGLSSSVIQPRDVLAPALAMPAAGLILVHNHPSGDTRPSAEDLRVTEQLCAAARLLGIELLDHLVVSRADYSSIKELGGLRACF